MANTEPQAGVVYQLRRLTDRWLQPMGGEVISTHDSEQAALVAYDREPQTGGDSGGGRSSSGSFVPNVVVRVAADGSESVVVRRTGGGRW